MTAPYSNPPAAACPEGLSLRTQAHAADVEQVGRLIGASGFFSAEERAIAIELVAERLSRGTQSGYEFLFVERGPRLIAYACYGPIPCTHERFDLYWIAVDVEFRHQGVGKWLLAQAERDIVDRGGQRVYVDTSSRRQYEPTRRFYESMGYARAALLEDFYATGDAKVIYAKNLCAETNRAE